MLCNLTLVVTLAALGAASPQDGELKALEGEWIFLEDRTEGRTLEQLNPPMSTKFSIRAEEGAVILVKGHGSGHTNVRIALDGTHTDVPGQAGAFVRYRGSWKDGVFTYQVEFAREAGGALSGLIQREFRVAEEGLVVRSNFQMTEGVWSVGLYRQTKDIPMPTPAKATINDLAWMAGNWSGTRGTTGQIAFEELWSPPKGGSMFAISRTINRDQLSAFEYLRILERDGGLVYTAQPNGGTATEFVMTEFSSTRAVFDNPRHDYPKRIVYELTKGGMTATIGFAKGGTPRKLEFKREEI